MVRPEEVLKLVRKRPFEPFRIRMDDGTVYEVLRPEFAMVGRTTMVVGIPLPRDLERERYVADRTVLVDLPLIERIELISPEAA
jgi:hypothetical protein